MKSRPTTLVTLCAALFFLFTACNAPMPKPRGMLRIDLPTPRYAEFSAPGRPYTFRFSRLANVELPPVGEADDRLNITYPAWGVTIYCSGAAITSATFSGVRRSRRASSATSGVSAAMVTGVRRK